MSPLEWGEAESATDDSGILGFYDRAARAIVMKRSAAFRTLENGEIVDESAWTLAHEAVHALQEQNFGLPRLDGKFSEDQRKIYAALPQTTEQILHVEKYLKGELGAQLAPPEPPLGHRVVARASVGELLTRASLDQCMAEGTAHAAAQGWNGDQILLSRDRATHTLLWNTAWDTAEDAEEFELAALQMVKCWRRRDREAKEDTMFSGESAVLRDGKRVALVYGFTNTQQEPPSVVAEEASEESTQLALEAPAQVVEKPRSPAEGLAATLLLTEATDASMETELAKLPYKELEPQRVVRPAYVARGVYINEAWNLRIRIPKGITPKTDDGRLLLEKPEHGFRVLAFQSDFHVTPESNAVLYELHRETLERVKRSLWPRDELRVTPLGKAIHRVWATGPEETAPSMGQMLIIPICNGTGSVVLISEWATPRGKSVSDYVFANLKAYAAGTPPICSRLNPEVPNSGVTRRPAPRL